MGHRLDNFLWDGHHRPGPLPGLSTGLATTCLASAATRPPPPGQLPLAWPPPPGQLPVPWLTAWSVHWPGHHLPGLCSDQATSTWTTSAPLATTGLANCLASAATRATAAWTTSACLDRWAGLSRDLATGLNKATHGSAHRATPEKKNIPKSTFSTLVWR